MANPLPGQNQNVQRCVTGKQHVKFVAKLFLHSSALPEQKVFFLRNVFAWSRPSSCF